MSEYKKASQVKVGDIIMIGDRACKVVSIKTSKTGKHGHAKVLFNGETLMSTEDMVLCEQQGHYAPSQAAWAMT